MDESVLETKAIMDTAFIGQPRLIEGDVEWRKCGLLEKPNETRFSINIEI